MAALYRCDKCNEDRADPICEKCGRETRELKPDAAKPSRDVTLEKAAASIARDSVSAPPPNPPKAAPQKARPPRREDRPMDTPPRVTDAPPRNDPASARPAADRPPATTPPVRPRPDPAPVEENAPRKIVGLDEFEALLKKGTKAIVMCGDSGTGKSEIAYGFLRALAVYRGESRLLTLRAPNRSEGTLGGTVAGEIWHQVINSKLAFLDPSGEFFKKLSPEERRKLKLPDVTEEMFEFVRKAVRKLAGIVLVVDLTRTLGPNDFSPWRWQEDDLQFVLTALRFLRYDRKTRPNQIGYTVNMANRVDKMPRIDKPVLVLFSKADQLPEYTNESPLELAQQYLPTLHSALMSNARRFRYDFCHTMINTPQGISKADRPCGVLLSMEWLLRDPLRWIPFQFPTSSWVIGGGK